MSRDQFFEFLDELAEDGLAFGAPTASPDLISLPVKEGGALLCFFGGEVLTYVEYEGGIFLELAEGETS